jgi:hypothetical protein
MVGRVDKSCFWDWNTSISYLLAILCKILGSRRYCNQKGGVLTTHNTIDCTQTNPWRPTWSWSTILHTYPQTFQHSVCLLTLVFAHYELETHNIQQQDKSHRIPTPAFLHSHTKIPAKKHSHIALEIIYTPKAQALFSYKFTKLQTFQSLSNLSISPNFCNNDLTKTTRRSGTSQAFS